MAWLRLPKEQFLMKKKGFQQINKVGGSKAEVVLESGILYQNRPDSVILYQNYG